MSTRHKPCSRDGVIHDAFGASVADLCDQAGAPNASGAITRALELRSFLALAEEQVARIRDRVHESMALDRAMEDLSASDLRMDAQWLEAALAARDEYCTALDDLLRTMPPHPRPARPVRFAQQSVTTALPPARAPGPRHAGAVRPRRPWPIESPHRR